MGISLTGPFVRPETDAPVYTGWRGLGGVQCPESTEKEIEIKVDIRVRGRVSETHK